jgi:hypothetical protein
MRLTTEGPARAWSAGLAIMAIAAVPSVCSAQSAAASKLKAAFTLNFVKFTEWPNLRPGLPFLVCVTSDESLVEAMTEVMSGQSVGGRAIQVARVAPDGAVRDCHLLFVTERQPQRFAATLEAARRLPILVVSDVEQSAKHGVTIELFQENGRLRFAINIDAMERSLVKVSSRLLTLAKIVRDIETP